MSAYNLPAGVKSSITTLAAGLPDQLCLLVADPAQTTTTMEMTDSTLGDLGYGGETTATITPIITTTPITLTTPFTAVVVGAVLISRHPIGVMIAAIRGMTIGTHMIVRGHAIGTITIVTTTTTLCIPITPSIITDTVIGRDVPPIWKVSVLKALAEGTSAALAAAATSAVEALAAAEGTSVAVVTLVAGDMEEDAVNSPPLTPI